VVNLAVGGEHAILERIKQRPRRDAKHFRIGRLSRAGTGILDEPVDVGVAEHDVAAQFVCDDRVGDAVVAEYAVRICVQLLDLENRQIGGWRSRNRLIGRADNVSHGTPPSRQKPFWVLRVAQACQRFGDALRQ
jgi:hypothetical protein